jgi:hypothetical protein
MKPLVVPGPHLPEAARPHLSARSHSLGPGPTASPQDADTLVSIDGYQSNHIRQVAAVAANLGLKCVLEQEKWVDWPDSVNDRSATSCGRESWQPRCDSTRPASASDLRTAGTKHWRTFVDAAACHMGSLQA